jgi:sortase A
MAVATIALRARRRVPRTAWLTLVPVALVLVYVGTNVAASLAQNGLEARWARAVASARGLSAAQLAHRSARVGDPVARLVIPSMSLDAVIVEGATPAQMRRGPAHLPASPMPGIDGRSVIIGNRFGFGGFFADIDRLKPGDRIGTQTLATQMNFVVLSVDVMPVDRLDVGSEGTRPHLVLIASAGRFGGGDRIVVTAVPEEGQ